VAEKSIITDQQDSPPRSIVAEKSIIADQQFSQKKVLSWEARRIIYYFLYYYMAGRRALNDVTQVRIIFWSRPP
jgi:hypothetical protein